MANDILHPSEKTLCMIVGSKLTRAEAAAIKLRARERDSSVSELVRAILLEWMRKEEENGEVTIKR